jgi:broad specificity phosphatase PhoE
MKIYLVRHFESIGNVNPTEYFRKSDWDIELSEIGKHQSIATANKIMDLVDYPNTLRQYPWTESNYLNMYYSSYKRAIQSANLIHGRLTSFEGYKINEFKESPLLVERAWGSLRDIVESGAKNNSHFNFFYRPLNGESFADAYQRVVLFDAWLKSTSKYEHNIVVAHGEFNKLYLMHLLGWTVEEFEKWNTPKNGEVFLIDDGKLSTFTPLTEKVIKH